MPRIPQSLIPIPAAAFVALAGLWIAAMLLVRPLTVRQYLVENIQDITEGAFDFSEFRLSRFPFHEAEFRKAKISFPDRAEDEIQADRLKIRLRLLSALFRRIDISRVELHRGRGVLQMPGQVPFDQVALDHIDLLLRALPRGNAFEVKMSADWGGEVKALQLKGKIRREGLVPWSWAASDFEGEMNLKSSPLVYLQENLAVDLPFKIRAGDFSGSFRFVKTSAESRLHVTGKTDLERWVYQTERGEEMLTSPVIDLKLNFQMDWDPNNGEILLKQAALQSPLGFVQFAGNLLTDTGEIRDFRLSGSNLVMESLPQYFLSFKEAVPINIGFSGLSDIEISTEGTLDHLSIHANWDLTPSLLTYSSFFSKPKDIPLNLGFDFLMKDMKKLSGDFTLHFQAAALKGTLNHLDLTTGEGEMNILTNKLQLEGWQALLPPLSDYTLKGEMKFFANINGNLQKPKPSKMMFNWILDDVSLQPKTGPAIERLNWALDFSPMSFEVKKFGLETSGSSLEGSLTVYNPQQSGEAVVKFHSPHLAPLSFWDSVERLAAPFFPASWKTKAEDTHRFLSSLFGPIEAVEDFSSEIHYKEKQWILQNLDFRAFGGEVRAKGKMDTSSAAATYWVEPELKRLDLARLLSQANPGEKVLSGALSLKGRFEGKAEADSANGLNGQGEFFIEQGKFHAFDLVNSVRQIDTFSTLDRQTSSGTPFREVHSSFDLQNKKIRTEDLVLLEEDFSVKADGDLFWDGNLNYRLEVYLSPAPAGPILMKFFGNPEVEKGKQLGPIPFLLSGPFRNPEIKPDPNLLSRFEDELKGRKVHRILRHFVTEDRRLEARKRS